MVIWGQSAGGGSVDLYNYAYPSDPIVKGVIADSGLAGQTHSSNDTTVSFTTVAGLVGCSSLNATAEMACMQSVDVRTLQKIVSNSSSGVSFRPTVDNTTVFANLTARMEKGLIAKIVSIFQVSLAISHS